MKWPWQKEATPAPEPTERSSVFSTHLFDDDPIQKKARTVSIWGALVEKITASLPVVKAEAGTAMDDTGDLALKSTFSLTQPAIPELLLMWYASQSFIGHQMCAILSQHWLIDKACSMPARDAIRQGFDIVSADEDKLDPKTIQAIQEADKSFNLNYHMYSFIRFGRIFGIRILFFKIESTDPDYYEKPFNIDGVTPGSYKGIVEVDPYWTAPFLDAEAASQSDTIHFYEPTWWMINGKKYHRSHLIIFKGSEVADFLKPSYLYGGIPVPQRIMERVYAAERTANEGPMLAQTKRTTVYKTDLVGAYANKEVFDENMQSWINWRDNLQIKLADREDDVQQLDTSLTDLDEIIMTQFQIVAAASNVPSTKLLGTSPKGFNASGDYEESSYHEELETIQLNDLEPFVTRHHQIMLKSAGITKKIKIEWNPLDSPTAIEEADIQSKNADTISKLVLSGSIDGYDGRDKLIKDKNSGFTFLESVDRPEPFDPDKDDIDRTETDKADIGTSKTGNEDTIAEISLNGAQVGSMLEVAEKVANGEMPIENGISLLTTAFPINDAQARKILDGVKASRESIKNATDPQGKQETFGNDGEDFPWSEFAAGFKEEQSHYDSVDGNELAIASIVLDHLREDSKYYSKMKAAGL